LQKRFKRLRRIQDEESEEEQEEEKGDEKEAVANELFEGSGDVSFHFYVILRILKTGHCFLWSSLLYATNSYQFLLMNFI